MKPKMYAMRVGFLTLLFTFAAVLHLPAQQIAAGFDNSMEVTDMQVFGDLMYVTMWDQGASAESKTIFSQASNEKLSVLSFMCSEGSFGIGVLPGGALGSLYNKGDVKVRWTFDEGNGNEGTLRFDEETGILPPEHWEQFLSDAFAANKVQIEFLEGTGEAPAKLDFPLRGLVEGFGKLQCHEHENTPEVASTVGS